MLAARPHCGVYGHERSAWGSAWGVPCHGQQPRAVLLPAARVEYCTAETWRQCLSEYGTPQRPPVVTLGKFDALHKGHMSLAAAAVQQGGTPVLISFTGMAEVLGWEPRLPLVAPCDRARVLQLWSQQLLLPAQDTSHAPVVAVVSTTSSHHPAARHHAHGNSSSSSSSNTTSSSSSPPRLRSAGTASPAAITTNTAGSSSGSSSSVPLICQRYIPFSEVRRLSPQAFVDILAQQLRPAGVVAGINYRFGYKAAGDAAALRQLAGAAGLEVSIVELVGAGEPGAVGVVSSTKIREMLATGRIDAIRRCLGRPYRLVVEVAADSQAAHSNGTGQGITAQRVPQSPAAAAAAVAADGTGPRVAQPPVSSSNGTNSSSSSRSRSSSSSRRMLSSEGAQLDIDQTCLLEQGSCCRLPKAWCCNEVPAAGTYACHVTVYSGATTDSDLLQLDLRRGAMGDNPGCLTSEQLVEVLVQDGEVLLPAHLLAELAAAGGLVAIDFAHRIRQQCKL